MYTRVTLQHIEVGEITEMPQQDNGNIHFTMFRPYGLGGKCHRVFLFDIDLLIIRYDTDHRNTAKLFQHLDTGLEKPYVTTELIDKNAFDAFPFIRAEQHHRTIHTGKDPAPVNVSHKDYISSRMNGHRQIHQVGITQIDFGDASGTFQHYRIIP